MLQLHVCANPSVCPVAACSTAKSATPRKSSASPCPLFLAAATTMLRCASLHPSDNQGCAAVACTNLLHVRAVQGGKRSRKRKSSDVSSSSEDRAADDSDPADSEAEEAEAHATAAGAARAGSDAELTYIAQVGAGSSRQVLRAAGSCRRGWVPADVPGAVCRPPATRSSRSERRWTGSHLIAPRGLTSR